MSSIRRRTVAGTAAALLAVAVIACGGTDEPERHQHVHPTPDLDTAPASPAAPPEPVIGTWTDLADLPEWRTEIGAVSYDGRIYVAGGLRPTQQLTTTFFIYDPETDAWEEGAELPEGRHHAPMAAHDGRVYVIGGYGAEDLYDDRDTLFIYDIESDSWSEGPPLPIPLAAHAAATTADGVIHVISGLSSHGLRDDHYAFDTTTGTWSTLPPIPTPREHIGAAYLDGVIYVAAGRVLGGLSGMQTFEAYDIAAQEWSTLPDVPTGRSGVAVAAFDGQIYVFGGETFSLAEQGEPNATYNEAERFDPATGEWEPVTPMTHARHGLGAGALDDGIVVVSGGPSVGWTYSPITEFWQP